MTTKEFVEHLDSCASGDIAAPDFEDWFEQESWDVHQSGDKLLTNAVFRVEALLSAYDEDRLNDQSFAAALQELANAIRPFVRGGEPVVERPVWPKSCRMTSLALWF
jgi:hypothetical protein